MGFLGWIKNRSSQNHQPDSNRAPEPRPENAKRMYARQDGQERANLTPMDRMPPDQRAQVDAIKAKLEKATRHIDTNAPAPLPAAGESGGGHTAERQNMAGQEKTAPALSPTSAQAGKTPNENAPVPSTEPPAKTQDKAVSRPQTVPRPRPSWER